ncbi:hypothetical protein M3J09_005169 [Ascochyta lentis]
MPSDHAAVTEKATGPCQFKLSNAHPYLVQIQFHDDCR